MYLTVPITNSYILLYLNTTTDDLITKFIQNLNVCILIHSIVENINFRKIYPADISILRNLRYYYSVSH